MRALLVAAAALAAILAAAPPASAQDVPTVISPLRVESDHNGVNIVDGKMMMDGPSLSAPAAPNLKFDRVQNLAPYVKGTINASGGADYSTASFSIHTGTGSSESFKCIDFDCESVAGTGSTFVQNARIFRQAGSGAVWHFNLKHVDTTTSNPRTQMYYASSASFPNGETLTYSYGTGYLPGDTFNRTWYRPVTVSSSHGYYISISYQNMGTDPSQTGWGSPAQATLYKSGDSSPIGQLTFSGGTVTDLGGRVYSCSGCSNALGADVQTTSGTLTLPGEGSAAVQVAQHSGAPLVAAVVEDGTGWYYSYGNPRLYYTNWRYDSVTVTGPNGFQQVYSIGGLGQLAAQRNVINSVTDPIGRTTSFQYDSGYRPILVTSPEGNSVSVGYDEFGNVFTKTTNPKPGSGLAPVTETASYPTDTCVAAGTPVLCYRPTWSRDGLGRQTDYVWNSAGQLIEQTDPADQNGLRKKTYITYDSSSGISRRSVVRTCLLGSTCGTNQEIRTEYSYWGATLLPTLERRVDSYFGRTLDTNFTYDSAGRLLSKDGPLPGPGDATYTRYDLHGRKSWEIGALSNEGLRIATRFTYRDSDDKVLYSETGTLPSHDSTALSVFSRSDFAYDPGRNPIRVAVSAAGTTHKVTDQSHDALGRLVCTAIRMNPAAFGEAPGACAFTTQGGQGPDRITRNHYDNAGQLVRVQKAFGVTVANGFPATLEQDYARYEYTANGQRKAVIDANNNRAEMSWDGHGRQKRWIFPSNTPGYANQADYEEYGYDLIGNRTSLRKRDGSVLSYVYDNLNRVVAKIVPERSGLTAAQTRDVYYDYNNAMGLQTKARFDNLDGEGITNYYDLFGLPTTVLQSMGGHFRYVSYWHDDAGNLARLTHPDGVHFGYGYDSLRRMTLVHDNAGIASIDDYVIRYWYKPEGPRHAAVRGAGAGGFTTVFYYDALQRPTAIYNDLPTAGTDVNIGLAYNSASQIVQRSSDNDSYAWTGHYNVSRGYSVNGLNQYTAAGPASFTYDANGNLTSDGTTGYTYDLENRLVAASNGASLVYDPLGRLVQTSGGVAGTTHFLYDGDKMIAEYNSAGTLLRRYVHGSSADEPVAVYEGAALGTVGRRYTLPDERGSVIGQVNANGSPSVINTYDAWGIPGAGNGGRFQYTGQAWLPELGMYHYKARIYSPTLGRFLQTDPIGYGDGVNLYAYVGNDPINARDPSGAARVCTAVTGSKIDACVSVDADGDGNVRDADLNASQTRSLGRAFHGFIRDNNGANLSRSGTLTYGDGQATPEQVNYARAIGQFVGHALPHGWLNSEIVVNTRLGSDRAERADRVKDRYGERFLININPTFMDHASNPSSMARSMFHGFGHIIDRRIHGQFIYSNSDPRHQGVDIWARRMLMRSGLGAGGCPAVGGGLFGLIGPDFPGC